MKVIKALLVSVEFIRTNKAEILGFLEKNWGIKNLVSDETIANVVRFTQATRKTQKSISVTDITDWTFAEKANDELKR